MPLKDMVKAGPDGLPVPPIILKKCYKLFSKPLVIILNKSLERAENPEIWKYTYNNPIFNSDKKLVKNDRPITKFSNCAKLFDSIINKKTSNYLQRFIIQEQHGNLRMSTITNLATFMEDLIKQLNQDNQLDVIYTDMSKAFDSMNVKILLNKLKIYSRSGKLLSWFESYFTG